MNVSNVSITGFVGRGCVLALLALCLITVTGAAAHPFAVGEHLTFTIQYGFIKAGTAELEVGVNPQDSTMVFTSRAFTNSFFDAFYKVRDQAVSVVEPKSLRSVSFMKQLCEGKFRDDMRLLFDYERGVVTYDDDSEEPLLPQARDILASFYHLRTQSLRLNTNIPLVYHSSRKNYPIHVKVHGVETVKVPAGEFRCLKIEPFLKDVGLFKQAGRLEIWLTADAKRMPVKLRSKVAFGAFEAVLESFEIAGEK